ncbi:MAG: MscL family protein [bacterium]|nr:MscL family protein [bacterium]
MIKEQFTGFFHFVRTQGVAGFAIGFILGRAVSDLIGSFVNDIINPVIGLALTRFTDLASLSVSINGSTIGYGKFISLFINFLILAAVVYFGIKKLSEKFDQPKDAPLAPGVKK